MLREFFNTSTIPRCSSCFEETLTATGTMIVPLCCHSPICLQTSRNTNAPISQISPVRSAMEMNCSGGTRPRKG